MAGKERPPMQSLRVKLLAPFIVGTLVFTLFLAVYTYSSARKAVEDATLLISEAKTARAMNVMSLLFKSMTSRVQNMVVDPHVTDLFAKGGNAQDIRAKTASWLEILIQGNEYFRDILVVDDKGICIASSNIGHIGNSYIDRGYVLQALDGIFAMGEPSVGLVTKKFSGIIAGPIDSGGKVVGALILINDFPKVVDYEMDMSFDSQTIFTALLTPEGMFAAHKDKELMGNEEQLFPDLYARLKASAEDGGSVSYSLLGKKYVGYARLEPCSKWLVISSGVDTSVFASAYRVGFVVLGISMAFLCGVAMMVERVANGVLRTLLSLITYAKNVSEGDLNLKLEDSQRKDELGVLHNALRRLVQSLQAMLVETQKASKMKGEFLANMSHEIRTPLNVIIGMTHLSLRDAGLSSNQRNYLDKIQLAAKSLLGLINDILDLSKVEAGMLELEEIRFNLRETIENSLAIHSDSALAKGIDLEMSYAEGTPEFFIGDPLRIGQVVSNLLSNAIKFTFSGRVRISCALAVGSAGAEGESDGERQVVLQICVEDSGVGIAEENIHTLFQPFTQADASTSRRFGGTGLGLAISDRIVGLLHGEFHVTSVLGKGTTFSFTMRLARDLSGMRGQREELPLEQAFERLCLKGKRILVAEDNTVNQMIMRELLAPSGVTVVMADNGLLAVEAAHRQEFDLVFMDMQMPVMDGLAATRAIRKFADTERLPIIAVTANAMKEDKMQGFACGMNDYLTKPVEPLHLLEMLRFWLKRQEDPAPGEGHLRQKEPE